MALETKIVKQTHNITLINSAIAARDKPTDVHLARDEQKVGHLCFKRK